MADENLFGDQEGTARVLWAPRPQPARGPKPALSLDRIARAAIEAADADGLPAVSMQRVASALGFTKMSLYRYVPGKAELVALMADTAIGGPPLLNSTPPDWRAQLRAWGRQMYTVLERHPWLLEATVGPRIMGPNELGWMESAIAALGDSGLDGGERMDAVVVISGHVRTIAQQARGAGPSADPEKQLSATTAALMRTHGERFPAVSAALASAMSHGSQDKALDFGLERILDGLGVLIAQRSDHARS